MKKFLALVLSATLALALLVGCGGSNSGSTGSNNGSQNPNTGASDVIGVVSAAAIVSFAAAAALALKKRK